MPRPGYTEEPVWRRYLRFVRPNVAADVDEELRFHFEMLVSELEARGLTTEEARREAHQRFGDGERVARWLRAHDERRRRTAHRRETMSTLAQHCRFAARSLRRQPAFTAAAVLTLALGIGATTAIIGVVDGVLLKPLPFRDSERLVGLWHSTPLLGRALGGQSYQTFDTYRRLSRTLDGIAMYEQTAVNIAESGTPERVSAARVSASFFPVLGVRPLLGRLFTVDDDRPGSDGVVVIGEGLWHRRFAGSPDVIGARLRVDAVPREVVGVVADGARFPQGETQLWAPLALDLNAPDIGAFRYTGIGRLRSDATPAGAAADLRRVLPEIAKLHPMAFPGVPTAELLKRAQPVPLVRPLREDVVGDIGRLLWPILGTVGFVLLAACANIANLCLVRAEARSGEFAVRAALGAGRRDALVRFFVEGVLLSGAGAVVGVALAAAALGVLRRTRSVAIPRLDQVGLDIRVLGAAAVVTLVVALLTSALPMLRVAGRDLAQVLRSGVRGTTHGRDRRRVQRTLVAAQVALAFVLLASSALLARTFVALRHVDPGFDAAQALTFRISLPTESYGSQRRPAGSVTRFHADLADRLARLPGVIAVGATNWRPLSEGRRNLTNITPEGDESRDGTPPANPVVVISPTYFRAMGIPLVAGREFGSLRESRGAEEAIVSAAFAAQVLGDARERNALGRRIRLMPTAPWVTVVGVVGSVRDGSLDREPLPVVYVPFNSNAYGMGDVSDAVREVTVVVRSSLDPIALAAAARREVAALDPQLAVYDVLPMDAVVRRSMARTTFTALLLTMAACVALLLGAIGVYGVVAYMVSMRRRELGLRVALGARPGAVSRMLAREGAGLAVVGVGVGIAGAVVITRALRALLFGVSSTDPLALGATALLLLLVCCAASWLPARRAGRVDPAVVLSAD